MEAYRPLQHLLIMLTFIVICAVFAAVIIAGSRGVFGVKAALFFQRLRNWWSY